MSTSIDNGIRPNLYHCAGVRVDGNIVRLWGTKKAAEEGARMIGWPVKSVSKVHTRFAVQWALNCGIEGGYLSRERYGELFRDRNNS